MKDFTGAPFVYNPAITNVNIDNQLAAILAQFNEDYIMDVIKDSLNNNIRVYALPRPNVVAAYEAQFKQLTDGYSSGITEISDTRNRVYTQIINIICNYFNLTFNPANDVVDLYSSAYWLYDFFVSNYTDHMKSFYVGYLIREKDSIYTGLELNTRRKDNDPILSYSKKLFKDPKLAAIHCDIDYVIDQIGSFDIDFWTILNCVYSADLNLPSYIYSLVKENVNIFKNYYEPAITNSPEAADLMINIKLQLQQLGGQLENIVY